MTARKKLMLKIAIGLLAVLAVCTLLSRTIYRLLLPVVETVSVSEGSLNTWVEVEARPGYEGALEILAGAPWPVTEVLVKKGAIVEAGAPLFQVDTRQAEIALEQSELALLRLKNQLTASTVTGSERAELEMQIEIAETELQNYRDGLPLTNDIQELRLKLAVIQLENQEEIDEEALRLAKEELTAYQRKGAGLDTAELLRLDRQISSLQKRLKNESLSDEKREELEAELVDLQEQRSELSYGYEDYDPQYEERLKQAVLQAEQNLKENPSERDRSVYELQKEIAMEELALYQQKKKSSTDLEAKKLELTVLQLKNRLAGSVKTEAEQQELAAQIRIAEKELAIQKESWPTDGIVTAPAAGKLTELNAEKGATLPAGTVAAALATEESPPCLRWSLSREAAEEYQDVRQATVTVPSEKNIQGQSENFVVNITGRTLDEATDTWVYTALTEEDMTGSKGLRVRMVKSGQSYQQVIPLSCLRQDAYGNTVVLVVETRQGIFSEEDYLVEMQVKVLARNSMNAAVECSEFHYDTRLVHYSSKPVSAGSVVSVGTVEP